MLVSCADAQKPSSNTSGIYFPPNVSAIWDELSAGEFGWNGLKLAEFITRLPTQDTRAFIILKDGKIVKEEIVHLLDLGL